MFSASIDRSLPRPDLGHPKAGWLVVKNDGHLQYVTRVFGWFYSLVKTPSTCFTYDNWVSCHDI